MHDRWRTLLAPLLIASAGVVGAQVAIAAQNVTLFERLNALDERGAASVADAAALDERREQLDRELEARWREADVATRAARPIRADVHRTLGQWLNAHRAARRDVGHGPAAPDDTRHLLGFAAQNVLPDQLKDVDVIRRADEERSAYHRALVSRGRLAVESSRVQAIGATAEAGRTNLIAAAQAEGIPADLEATARQLEERLAQIPAVDLDVDFHRSKGTLARPVAARPEFTFGGRGPLVRSTGWTWRGVEGAVLAAGAGTVVFAETVEGYGLVVAVEHGGGYRSLYAHLREALVAPGTRVDRAATLGHAGASGSLDGIRTYFELRKNGRAVDPAPWFVQR